jgi:hypothetical protein
MFEDIRRQLAHQREAKEKEKLKKLERERRLSYIRLQRLKERKDAEEELKEQISAELSAREAAKQALAERRQMERELKRSRSLGIAERLARGLGKAAKVIAHDIPVGTVRTGAKLNKPGMARRLLIGDTRVLFGAARKPTSKSVSMDEFIFGKPSATLPTAPRKKSPGILDIDRDVLK